MTTTLQAVPDPAPHWTDEVDVTTLHEPTVRAIIDTMRRTGAKFAAHVLECQLKHDQIEVADEDRRVRALRDLADFIERNPDVDVPVTEGVADWWPLRFTFYGEDAVPNLHKVRRAIGGRFDKDASAATFSMKGRIGEAYIELQVPREQVCERVVVGTETKLVADPDAPKVEVEEEIVEWVCPDALLAGES